MLYLIGFIVAAYTLTRVAQAPFLVPGDGGPSHQARRVAVSALSVVGGLVIAFFTHQFWQQAADQARAETEREQRLIDMRR